MLGAPELAVRTSIGRGRYRLAVELLGSVVHASSPFRTGVAESLAGILRVHPASRDCPSRDSEIVA